MSMVLEESVADVLQGDRTRRPSADHEIARELRRRIDDRLAGPISASGPVRVTAADLRLAAGTPLDVALALRLRGALITQLLALLTVGFPVTHPFAEALSAWRATGDSPELLAYAHSLSGDDLARVRTDVDAHGVTLVQRLGVVSPRWWPRVGVRSNLRLANGRVRCLDTVDLVVGSPGGDLASIALLDVTTSPLSETQDRILRYHALCETLRTGVAPLRAVVLSTATGDIASLEVDRECLSRAADELVGAVDGRTS